LIDQPLKELLIGIGVDPEGYADAFDVWCRLRAQHGPRVNLIDLYALVAHPRGLDAHELPIAERVQLTARALPFMADGFEIIAGSGRSERDPIEIVLYSETWPNLYAGWRNRLAEALGSTARRIEHVGSTAVPGLPAKPIIDIQVSVDDVEDEPRYVPPIEALGIQLRNRDLEHRFFRPFSGLPRGVQVHVCGMGSEWERRHLLFRDYLRADAAARQAYVTAKQRAAQRWRDDRVAYTEAKDGQIRELIAAAEVWARSRHDA
jgi:GrpB-like predicted nucleotidyltransferase (UPF0157 family)